MIASGLAATASRRDGRAFLPLTPLFFGGWPEHGQTLATG
jgi:hypothetical protein